MDFKKLGAMFGGSLSGMGQGMMSNKFRSSYNAGQGGMWDLYNTQRVHDALFPTDITKLEDRVARQRRANQPALSGVSVPTPIGGI